MKRNWDKSSSEYCPKELTDLSTFLVRNEGKLLALPVVIRKN